MREFGEQLRFWMRRRGLTNAAVADLADIHTRTFGHYVTGRSQPKLDNLLRICEVLEITPNQLLGIDDDSKPMQRTGADRRQALLRARLLTACAELDKDDLELLTRQAEAIVDQRAKKARS